jgi:thioredoxin reductase (NADPH)
MTQKEKVLIIGSGPAGLTAAIYTSRADLKPLMIEGYQSGGQLMLTTDVENYPGFPDGIAGPEMMSLFRKQAERFGTRFITKDVTKVDFSKKPYSVEVGDEKFEADTIIISTGASAKWLGIPSEQKLMGKGVSACATCDGAFFRNQEVFLVGGGDTAMEEALFLTKFASKVSVVHRRDKLRASKIMQDRALAHEKITFLWDSAVDDILGETGVEGVRIKNLKTGEMQEFPSTGIFMAIGHQPNTKLFQGQLEMDATGYLVTDDRTRTKVPGVFACGDVQDHIYRQAVTAAGTGCASALEAERYLESVN